MRSPCCRPSVEANIDISVQTADFDLGTETNRLRKNCPQAGAVVSFLGLVRDISDGQSVNGLWLEHYPGMTEHTLTGILAEARTRWPIFGIRVIHRVGALAPADQIVLVLVATAHRHDAFLACEFIMDYLKTQALFWKKESTSEQSNWVATQDSDTTAANRWL